MKIAKISLIAGVVLALLPGILFLAGIQDFHRLSPLWYALLAPWMLGFGVTYGLSHRWVSYTGGLLSALVTWFALAKAMTMVVRARRSVWFWLALFLVLYGAGIWALFTVWNAL
jgi:hypothetical protein